MSLLTDDEKRAIFDQIESGKDTPWFERYANALEARLLAKLAVMELPANAPHVMRRIRACESEVPAQVVLEHALRQAYAQGAASQLSAEPVGFIRKWALDGEEPVKERNENGRKAWPLKFKLLPITETQCLKDDIPIFTRKKPS